MKENLENMGEIDPYGEENWNEKQIELDTEKMASDCLNMVLDDMYGYQGWIEGVLRNFFNQQDSEYLKEFLGYENDEDCPECEGSGTNEDGTECERCGGEGTIDIYEYKYGK